MRDSEIKTCKIIIEALEKVKDKYKKKADKERQKANSGNITYEGDVYNTEADILAAYAYDAFSASVCDRLIDRLNRAKGLSGSNEMTESELIFFEIDKYISGIQNELLRDKQEKEHKAYIDKRMEELIAQGCSYREAETVIENEKLMMQID